MKTTHEEADVIIPQQVQKQRMMVTEMSKQSVMKLMCSYCYCTTI